MSVKTLAPVVLNRETGKPYATITYDSENNWCFIDWEGFLTVDLVKAGSEELLKIFKQVGNCSKILVDNSRITGPWHKANDWYATDWNPRAVEAGLKTMGVILSADFFTQLSLQGFEKVSSGAFTVGSFPSKDEAHEWLKGE